MPGMAPRVLEQLGYAYEYGPTATAAPRSSTASRGAAQAGPGRVTATPSPLFPRAEAEIVEEPA